MTLIAHAGHWIEGAVFALPVLLVAGALLVSSLREKRRRRRRGDYRSTEGGPGDASAHRLGR